jgi:hypothetical protein
LGIRIFILIPLKRKIIIDSHWFIKDEGAIDWWERFSTSIGQRSKLKEGSWKGIKEKKIILCFGGKKRKNWRCEKDISFEV